MNVFCEDDIKEKYQNYDGNILKDMKIVDFKKPPAKKQEYDDYFVTEDFDPIEFIKQDSEKEVKIIKKDSSNFTSESDIKPVNEKKVPTKEEIEFIVEMAFEKYDTDQSGFLERDEIKNLLTDTCNDYHILPVTDDQIDEVINAADDNKDGMIDFEELHKIILSILAPHL